MADPHTHTRTCVVFRSDGKSMRRQADARREKPPASIQVYGKKEKKQADEVKVRVLGSDSGR